MFTDKQLEEILEVFLKRAQGVNEEYLIRMGEQIREIGELIPSSVNRLVQLKRMHANLDAAKKEIARLAEISAEDLEKVLEKAMETDARFVANTFGNAYKPSVLENAALQQILRAQLEVTLGELKNLSMTTISSEAYRNAVDKGIQAVQSGMEDYNTAIRRALREAAEAGVRMEIRGTDATEARVGYGGKYTRRLDSAVRQNVLDGIRSLSNSVLEQLGEEFGADGVELSAHALCAEDHLPYQGRQYSRKEFDKIQEEDLDRPFGMWNCRHSIHPIILGVSKPAYSEEELSAYRENSKEQIEIDGVKKTRYQWTQEQRKIETAVRRQKDVEICARAAGNAPLRRDAQRNINALTERYGKISEKAGISRQMERMRVEGFKAVSKRELKKAAVSDTIKKKEEWLRKGYDQAVQEGDLSALTGFEHYKKVAEEVEMRIVGIKTSDGIVIEGYVTHFLDRIMGSYEKKREPVSIDDILDTLLRTDTEITGIGNRRTYKHAENVCKVGLNPETKKLIQATPKKKGE